MTSQQDFLCAFAAKKYHYCGKKTIISSMKGENARNSGDVMNGED